MSCFDRMAKREVLEDLIVGATALTASPNYTRRFELSKDPVDGTLGDPDGVGDLTDSNVRIPGYTQQHMAVIAQESPNGGWGRLCHGLLQTFVS